MQLKIYVTNYTNMIYKLRKIFFKKKLYKIGAYHEAGHVVYSYLYGYTCNFTEILPAEPGNGRTEFVFGQHNVAVNTIINQLNTILNGLSANQQQYIVRHAHYLSMIFSAGACSEAFFFKPFYNKKYRPIISGPDLEVINSINGLLGQIHSNPTMETLRKSLCLIQNFEGIRISIEAIANAILNSPEKRIEQVEIQQILTNTNFNNTINDIVQNGGNICR